VTGKEYEEGVTKKEYKKEEVTEKYYIMTGRD
jgi:hypothetical protein